MADTGDKVAEAVRLQEAGQTAEAEAILLEAVSADPDNIDAQFRLAVLYMHAGRFEESVDAYVKVLALNPTNPGALANLGAVLQILGRTAEAEARYREAIAGNPALDAAHINLGNLLQESGRGTEAIESYRAAVRVDPANTSAMSLLASALIGAGKLEDALQVLGAWQAIDADDPHQAYLMGAALLVRGDTSGAIPHLQRAVDKIPETAAATLARALVAQGRHGDADRWFQRAVNDAPGDKELVTQMGANLRELGRLSEAAQVFEQVLAHDPIFAAALIGLGTVRQSEYRHWEALKEFDRALKAEPDNAAALANKAISLQLLGRSDEARLLYERAVEADPKAAEIRFNLGTLLQAVGRYDEARSAFRRALDLRPGYAQVTPFLIHMHLKLCEWRDLEPLTAQLEANTRAELARGGPASSAPFSLFGTGVPFDLQMEATRAEAAAIGSHVLEAKQRLNFAYAPRTGKLRVGYLSPDFRSHSAARLFAGLLKSHGRDKVELFGYSLAPTGTHDESTEWFQGEFDTFRDISEISHENSAVQINGDGVHVLVDLASHTRGSRPEILALQPAPVQCHYLGYNLPLGADWCRYLIGDPVSFADQSIVSALPADLVMLKGCWTAAEPPAHIDPNSAMTRAEAGLPVDGTVFANFNASQKCEPIIWGAWMRILAAVPGSVLWMLDAADTVKRNLVREAETRGISADRLLFAPALAHAEHLRRMPLADIAFDTYYYKGGATALEFLAAGVPVLSLRNPGPAWGASLLEAAGTPETAANDLDAYERIAVELALDPPQLAALKARLLAAPDSAPLFDIQSWARDVEAAYETMWADAQNS